MLRIEQTVIFVLLFMMGLKLMIIFHHQTCGCLQTILDMGHFGIIIMLDQLVHLKQFIGLILYHQILGKIGLGELDVS